MHCNKKARSHVILVALGLCLASASLAGVYLGVRAFNFNTSGSIGSVPWYVGLPQPYSYIIDTNTTHYFMFDGKTGNEDYSSTNASYIFEKLSGKNGTFFLKGGVYSIDSEIDVTTKGLQQEWIGAGSLQTTIKVTSALTQVFFINATDFITIRNLRFECNYLASYAIYYNGTTGASCRGVFEDNDFRSTTYYAMRFNRMEDEWVRVEDNVFRYTSGGIYADIGDSQFKGNYFACQSNNTDTYQGSINLLGGSNIVVNNYFGGGYKQGIFISTDENIIEGNIFDYYRWDGIVIYGGKGNIIDGNRISGCGREANNTYSAIRMKGGATNNTIARNYLQSDASNYLRYAILEESTLEDYNNVKDNSLAGTFGATPAICTQGTHTLVSGNLG